MVRMQKSALIAILVMSLAACSGNSNGGPAPPTGPGPAPTAITIRVVSAVNGSPVPGATVTLAGKQAQADGSGNATLAYDGGPSRTELDILASGFLEHKGRFAGSGMTVELLPRDGVYSEKFMHELVYKALSQMIFPTAAVCFVPSAELQRPDLLVSLQAQAAEVARATKQPVSVTTSPSGCAVFDVVFDSTLNIAGSTSFSMDGSMRITGGRIRVRSETWVLQTGTVTHEMGHALGLGHNPEPGVMSIAVESAFEMRFTAKEEMAFAFQRKRTPGNSWEDRAPGR